MILDELDRMGAPNTELRKRQTGTRKGDGCSCKGLVQFNAVRHPDQSALCGRYRPWPLHASKSTRASSPIMSRIRTSGLCSRTPMRQLSPVRTSRRCRTSSKRLLRLGRRVCRRPMKSEQRSSTCSRVKSSVLTVGRRCTFTARGSTRTSGDAGMPTMSAALRSTGDMSTVPLITRGRTRLKPMSSMQFSFKLRLRLTMTSCWTSSGAARARKNIRDQQNALITSLNLRLNGVSKKRNSPL